MDAEVNPRVVKINRKIRIAKLNGLCTICPPHGGENAPRKLPKKSWKFKSKHSKQFMLGVA